MSVRVEDLTTAENIADDDKVMITHASGETETITGADLKSKWLKDYTTDSKLNDTLANYARKNGEDIVARALQVNNGSTYNFQAIPWEDGTHLRNQKDNDYADIIIKQEDLIYTRIINGNAENFRIATIKEYPINVNSDENGNAFLGKTNVLGVPIAFISNLGSYEINLSVNAGADIYITPRDWGGGMTKFANANIQGTLYCI